MKTKLNSIPFWKMSGSGNDFVVLDNRQGLLSKDVPTWAQRLCDRHFGVGADGLLMLESSTEGAFRMIYYNADGSRASMCGNGARCISWAAHQKGVAGDSFQFLTDDGLVGAKIEDQVVEVTLQDARDYRPLFSLEAGGKKYRVASINTGVPHAIIIVPRVDKIDLPVVGPLLRHHKAFGPKGANVNFVQRVNGHALKVRTFERGVEGETLACGTGVSASAIVATRLGLVSPSVSCETTGGDRLTVSFKLASGDPVATEVRLKGPVRLTFKGEFLP